jgi:hypothetical protein
MVGSTLTHFPGLPSFSKSVRRAAFRVAELCAALLLVCGLASAQRNTLDKMPVVDKVTNPSTHEAFTGTVQSLDEKQKILNVNSVEGGITEIFPIKKGTAVIGSGGARLKLTDLKPGTSVIVYYEQRTDRISVQHIDVISAKPKTPAPHS